MNACRHQTPAVACDDEGRQERFRVPPALAPPVALGEA